MKHFISNERDRAAAKKRGGPRASSHCSLESIDFASAETRYRLEPAHDVTAERIFERRWALTLLDRVLSRLQAEYATPDKMKLFQQLKGCLVAPEAMEPYAQLATDLAMTEGAVKVAVHRLRQRYRRILRNEIAQTVDDAADVDDEIRDLFNALAAP
jgi:RNA polymerase sigma-70 factor (ECF subfamily)